uniref:Uncharacterized protein n=1 Tax=Timema genevievae TaxID=629358 RepID=A0A7R9JXQ3_TIMGE|nr:unnamed protein product [Timema genevievae]
MKSAYVRFLQEEHSDLPAILFPSPVVTRWNSWFHSVLYLNDYSDALIKFLGQYENNNASVEYLLEQQRDPVAWQSVKLQMVHSDAGTKQGNGTANQTRRLSSPGFMRTALSSRRSRGSPTDSTSLPAKLKSDNWEYWHSRATHISGPTAINGHHPSSTEESVVKKTSGLKKMVKKFF